MLDDLPDDAEQLKRLVHSIRKPVIAELDQQPRYLCGQCGLKPRMLFWQCPSCKRWGSIAPAEDRLKT